MKNLYFLNCIFFIFLSQLAFSQSKPYEVKGKILQKDSILKDIDFLEKALTEIHAGIYRYNSKADIKKLFQNLRSEIKENISEADWMKKLAQTVNKIRCGHTYVNPWNMRKDIRNRLFSGSIYFPLGFKIIDKRFYVIHNASENKNILQGAEILSINGISTKVIYDKLASVARSDGNNFSSYDYYLSLDNYNVKSWKAFDLYFPLFFPLKSASFEITYQNYGKKKTNETKVLALTKAKREEIIKERYGNEALDTKKWTLDLSNPKVAIMRLGTFAIWNWKGFDQKAWFKEAFEKINEKNIPNLIIDIRGNGGGLGEPRNELISYLIKEKIVCNEAGKVLIRTTKLNPELVPHLETWNKYIIEGLPKEFYSKYNEEYFQLKETVDCDEILPKANRYKGKVYIFGNGSNVSSTYILLDQAKQFNFATFIGKTSGGNQQGINGGEYAFAYLPYSQMEIDIPLKYFAPANERPDAGISPKIKVKPTQKTIAENKDSHLEYVLENMK